MSTRTRILMFVGVAAFLAAVPAGAMAHPPANYYAAKWPGTQEVYGFTPSVPANWRPVVDQAASQWSAVSGATLDVVHGADYAANYTPNDCNARKTGIHTGTIDGKFGVLGRTYTCWNGAGQITQSNVVFDTAEPWYVGTGTPTSSQVDLFSVATHELGHSTGFGTGPNSHFTGSALCPNSAAQQTMCPSYTIGTTWQRSLATHDQHTYAAEY
jgi:hypothetical protein